MPDDQKGFFPWLTRYLTTIVVGLVGIADRLGALDKVSWLKESLPTAGFILIAWLLDRSAQQSEKIERLESGVNEIRKDGLTRMEFALRDLENNLTLAPADEISHLKSKVDPAINKVIGQYIDEQFDAVIDLFRNQTFELPDVPRFAHFYQNTLKAYSPATFHSTSIPFREFFWGRPDVTRAIYTFLRNKENGMRRVFILEDRAQLEDPEVNLILRCQKEIGVDVYTVLKKDAANEWPNCFMFDTRGRIGWELEVDNHHIKRARLKWGEEDTNALRTRFNVLENADSYERFEGGLQPDPNSGNTPSDEAKFKEFEEHEWQARRVADSYDRYFGPLMLESAEQLLNVIVDPSGISRKNLLDVACGPGYLAGLAQKKGAEVVAIDASAAMLDRASENFPTVRFLMGDAEKLDFADASFSLATINFGIIHFSRPETVLAEIYRVLKPGGTLGFTVWTPDVASGIGIVSRAIEALEDQRRLPPQGPPFFRFADGKECRSVLNRIGFHQIAVHPNRTMTWNLRSGSELFSAFHDGTARIGARIRSQEPATLEYIREIVQLRTDAYRSPGRTDVQIPMPYIKVTGVK